MQAQYNVIGTSEIAQIVNATRQTVTNWRSRYANFPKAVGSLNGGPIFDRTAIIVWLISREKVIGADSIFDFTQKRVLNEKVFGKFVPKFGAFDFYRRVLPEEISIGDQVKVTVPDALGNRQIYEALICANWANNYLALIQKSYSNESAWPDEQFPQVGEYHFLEAMMITVGRKVDGTEYGGKPTNKKTDPSTFVLKLYSPRWGHEDRYKLKLSKQAMEFYHQKLKVAICTWSYESGMHWKKHTVESILLNDNIIPPANFERRLEHIYRSFLSDEISHEEIEALLAELADWINAVTENRPQLNFWSGLL